MTDFFSISTESCRIGFQTHVTLNTDWLIESQIHRRSIAFHPNLDANAISELKKIIEWNSSLRIGFGWSFECVSDLRTIMHECYGAIHIPFDQRLIRLTSDLRGDWFGFIPFNAFDRIFYEDLCTEDLVYFNNKLIQYQTDVIKFITSHKIYQSHMMIRDEYYRFNYFKSKRKDPVALSESFQYYMESVANATGVTAPISRDTVEGMVGCHFLYQPDLFFELIQFYKLKGQIHE